MAIPKTRQVFRRTSRLSASSSDPQTLTLATEPIPVLSPTSVLIRVHAVSLNYRDANIIHNTNPWPVLLSGIPCSDCAGAVIAVGENVTRFVVGDRVSPIFDQLAVTGREQNRAWLGGEVDGVLASHVVFDQEKCVRVPACLDWAEAALLPCAGVTAWSGLGLGEGMTAGKTVLLMGK